MKNTFIFFCILLFSASQNLNAQEAHGYFKNFSFEDFPRPGIAPVQWFSYDFEKQSPPDVHPCNPPVFGVKNEPYHGKTYLGLVTRENNTYESVTQLLENTLTKNKCYSFSIYLSQSPSYKSKTTWAGDKEINFTAPTVLQIWGGNKKDDEVELLVTSPPINHTDWKKYTMNFAPSKKIDHIILEASFPTPSKPTNGHILLDNLSPIFTITCELENDEVRPSTNLAANAVKNLELMTIVQEKNGSFAFDKNNDLTPESKISLKEIGSILLYTPDQKLLFYFKSEKRKQRVVRLNMIHAAMGKIGYTRDMYEVISLNNKNNLTSRVILKHKLLKNGEILIDLGKR